MPKILDLHIHRKYAGVKFAFDKVYLVHRDDRDYIPKIFGYALVMPFTSEMITALTEVKPNALTKKHFRRNDEDKNIPLFTGRDSTPTMIAEWWSSFLTEHDAANRVAVVPVLTSTVRKHIRPRYLTAKKWLDARTREDRLRRATALPIISEMAYLATPHPPPDDRIRPLCNICPRLLLHVQGECKPGQMICYKSLDFSEIAKPNTSTEDASVQSDND